MRKEIKVVYCPALGQIMHEAIAGLGTGVGSTYWAKCSECKASIETKRLESKRDDSTAIEYNINGLSECLTVLDSDID